MYELLYTSIANQPISEQDLLDILNEARERNSRQHITGMLLFNQFEFVQLLEGEEADVKDVMAAIEKDQRHASVKIFYEGPIQERAFQGWSMAFQLLDASRMAELGPGFEAFASGESPQHIVATNPNVGKELFLTLRQDLG